MAVWGVVNPKGGVGKSTTVAHLGAVAARRGRRTLLVDLAAGPGLHLHFQRTASGPIGARPLPVHEELPLYCAAHPTLLPQAPDALLDFVAEQAAAHDLVLLDAPTGGLAPACLPLLCADVGLFVTGGGALEALGAARAFLGARRIRGPRPRLDKVVLTRRGAGDDALRAALQKHCGGAVAAAAISEREEVAGAVWTGFPASGDAAADFAALYDEVTEEAGDG